MARHDNAEFILEKHVNDSFEVLKRTSLRHRPFWQRHELLITAGGILIATGVAMPDILSFIPIKESFVRNSWTVGAVVSSLLVGVILTVLGWLRGTGYLS